MGAGFDEMHDRSHAWHPSVPPAAQRNRLLLNAIMFGGGFVGITSEWWHFELPDAARYPLLDDQIDCYTVTPITTQHFPLILEPGYEDYTCVKRVFSPRSDSRCAGVCPPLPAAQAAVPPKICW